MSILRFFISIGRTSSGKQDCINYFFGANRFGKVLQPLGIDFVYTPAGVVMAQFFVNLPYAVKNFSASFDMLDHKARIALQE